MNITEFVEVLRLRLAEHFRDGAKMVEGLAYRKDETGAAVHAPAIYSFTVPTSDLSDGMPKKTPCVVITVPECVEVGAGFIIYRVRLALCICYPGISSGEYVKRVGANDYEEAEGEENSDAGRELVKTSFLFTEQILRALDMMHDLSIQGARVETCEADLPDYPFAVSAISFNTRIIRRDHLEEFY